MLCISLTLTVPIFLILLSVHPFSPPLWLALQRKRPSIVWTVHPQWTMKVDINMSCTCCWECHFYSNMIYFLISSCRETHFRQVNVFFLIEDVFPHFIFAPYVLSQRFSYSDKDTMKCLHTHSRIPFIVCVHLSQHYLHSHLLWFQPCVLALTIHRTLFQQIRSWLPMYPINLSVAVSTVSLPSCLLSLKNRRLCVCVCAQNTLESLAKG